MVHYQLLEKLFGFGANLVEQRIDSIKQVSVNSITTELKGFLDDMLVDTKRFGTLDRVIILGDVTLNYVYSFGIDSFVTQITNAMIGRPSYGLLSVSDEDNTYAIFTPDNTKRPGKSIMEITTENDNTWKLHFQRYGNVAQPGAQLDITIPLFSEVYLVKAK
ncbi:MAG: hypothetical protein U9R34_02810 [Nanoarchaeota archaeon]|nr:hypothetical protein [Nanoarchaeota archaeon]